MKKQRRPWSGPGYAEPRAFFLLGWIAILSAIPAAFVAVQIFHEEGVGFYLFYSVFFGLIALFCAFKTRSIIMTIFSLVEIFSLVLTIMVIGIN